MLAPLGLGVARTDLDRAVASRYNPPMREAATLVAAGLTVGTIAALLAARTASSLLFGVKPYDPITLATAIAGLTIVATLASYVPAWRASRLEPTVALRED